MIPQKVEPIKCLHDKLLVSTHFPPLLEEYRLTKLLYYKSIVYPRLVKMFNVNLKAIVDKLSCYVIHKDIFINSNVFTKEFDMNPSPPMLIA